ncbi:hypothetical protein FRC06_011292 [Ceratobasidium sp. 370]|nr:hypothetical protein FRC06_011292 [Ceratobasidium sp. 370]
MKVVNNYIPPPKSRVVLPDPDAPYDLNFRFPVRELESDRIKLTPLIPSIHGKALSEAIQLHPELLRYLPWAPSSLVDDYDTHYESLMRSDPSCVEIGYAIVLPAYQRSFVSTHAIGLLLRYALDLPADGGLGLRRVQWQTHADNAPSIRAARRMGMKLEGIMR